jgi:hypothetical protein
MFCACNSCFNKHLRTQKVCYTIYEHFFLYLTSSLKVIVEIKEEARVKGCDEAPAKLLIL